MRVMTSFNPRPRSREGRPLLPAPDFQNRIVSIRAPLTRGATWIPAEFISTFKFQSAPPLT